MKGRAAAARTFYLLPLALLLTVFVALALGGCGKKKPAGVGASQSVPVSVAAVEKRDLTQVATLYGRVAARQSVSLAPKTQGRVACVPVKVGVEVEPGQVLVQLDDSEILAQLKQAQGALEAAVAGQREQSAVLLEAQANLERAEKLYSEGAISRQAYEAALYSYQRASSGRSDALVRQAEASLNYWQSQLENTLVKSPIRGQVASLDAEPGEVVGPSSPLVTVVDIDAVCVEISVPEYLIGSVREGDAIEVKVPAAGGGTFVGRAVSVAPAADPKTKTFQVKVEIENPQHQIKPGMFAEVEVQSGELKGVLTVPKEAVVDKGEVKVVYVVEEGLARERKVKIGYTGRDCVQVLGGLSEGDTVVTAGHGLLRDGTAVEVKNR